MIMKSNLPLMRLLLIEGRFCMPGAGAQCNWLVRPYTLSVFSANTRAPFTLTIYFAVPRQAVPDTSNRAPDLAGKSATRAICPPQRIVASSARGVGISVVDGCGR